MQRFTELKVWQRNHALVLEVYRLTKPFPADERCGLTSQLRRAALSVQTNIAEGSKRQTRAEYSGSRFLNIAKGSPAETEYLLMAGRDLGYVSEPASKPILTEANEIARMLNGLRNNVGKPTCGAASVRGVSLKTLNY